MRRPLRPFVVSLLCALLALNGCAHPAGSGAPSREGTLVIGEVDEPRSLNPLLVQGYVSEMLGALLFTFLVAVDAHGNQIPEAAREVPTQRNGGISPDGRRIVYHLRPGIRWQDGVPLTARDCVFTYRAISNPRTNLPSRSGYDSIANVTAPDTLTVVVTLKHPYAPITDAFLAPDFNYPILPEHVLRRYSDLNAVPFNARPVGSGAFVVVDWQRGDHLTLERNDRFFLGRPKLRRIIIKFVPSYDTLLNELQTHELDAGFAIAAVHYDRLRALRDVTTRLTPLAAYLALYFNARTGPTADVRVRRALALGIDVRSLVHEATHGVWRSDDAMRGMLGWAYRPSPEPAYDPAAAARLLQAAGWRRGADGIRVKAEARLSLTFIASTVAPSTYATVIQQALARIGADVAIKTYPPISMFAPAAAGGPIMSQRFALGLFQIYVGAGDPDTLPYLSCDQRAPAGFNLGDYCNPQLDRVQQAAASTFDRARRIRAAAIVEHAVRTQLPMLMLAQGRRVDAVTRRLHGFTPAPITPYYHPWMWSLDP